MTLNLDQVAAECAQAMVRNTPADKIANLERLSTKALGVLQAQGVYALMLFLFSRTSDEAKVAPFARAQLYAALQRLPAFRQNAVLQNLVRQSERQADAPAEALKFFTDSILSDLDTTLLVRDLYEQALIYTRYGAKAAGG